MNEEYEEAETLELANLLDQLTYEQTMTETRVLEPHAVNTTIETQKETKEQQEISCTVEARLPRSRLRTVEDQASAPA